jgi:hypothetical protein
MEESAQILHLFSPKSTGNQICTEVSFARKNNCREEGHSIEDVKRCALVSILFFGMHIGWEKDLEHEPSETY